MICATHGSETYLEASAGIELVAQGIAEKVKSENGASDGGGREEDEMGRVEEVESSVVEHGSPAWRGGGDAEAKE